jgi:hypothetical protein
MTVLLTTVKVNGETVIVNEAEPKKVFSKQKSVVIIKKLKLC